jgi:hypothetical protein
LTTAEARPLAYVAGVLLGDGWCSRLTIGLRVKDQDFATAFTRALLAAFHVETKASLDERGYWLVRTSNKTGRFNRAISFKPKTDCAKGAWLSGLFDSEGNAYLGRQTKTSPNAKSRRIAIYSTNTETIRLAALYLSDLGITSRITQRRHTEGHLGDKPVYELAVRCSLKNFARFAILIPSHILRKQSTIDAIVDSYGPVAGLLRAAQLRGVAMRKARQALTGKY